MGVGKRILGEGKNWRVLRGVLRILRREEVLKWGRMND